MTTPVGTAQGYFGIGKQTAWGTSAEPSKFSYYRNVSPDFKVDVQAVREGGGPQDNLWAWKKSVDFDGSFDIYARPDITAAVLAYFLGADAKTLTADPYLHTITPSGFGIPLSFEYQYNGIDIQRVSDALISSVTIGADNGTPANLKADWQACAIEFPTAATPSYETDRPPIFWDAAFVVDSVAVAGKINKFEINMAAKTFDDIRTSSPLRDAIVRVDRDINASFSMVVYDKDMLRTILTGSAAGTTIGNPPVTGSLVVTMTEEDVTPVREIKITIPNLYYSTPKITDMDDDNKPLILDVAGVAVKPTAGEIITVAIQNGVSTSYTA